ncbi:hypothetical protein GCM10009587_35210 [Microbacterium maritypicum]
MKATTAATTAVIFVPRPMRTAWVERGALTGGCSFCREIYEAFEEGTREELVHNGLPEKTEVTIRRTALGCPTSTRSRSQRAATYRVASDT